jgi:predicted RND superfamily exporter protein
VTDLTRLVGLALGAVSTHVVLKEIGHYLGVGTILSVIMVLIVLPGLLYLFDAVVMGRK